MTNKMNITTKSIWKLLAVGAAVTLALAWAAAPAKAQRVLGVDISYWNRGSSSGSSDGISQAAWNTAYFVVVGVPLTLAVALAAAVVLDRGITKLRSFFRLVR